MKSFYAIAQAGLFQSPGVGHLLDIPIGAAVSVYVTEAGDAEQATIPYNGLKSTLWTHVKFRDLSGWIYDPKLEPLIYFYQQDVVGAAHPTPDAYDLKQYLLVEGRTLYNGCGEFCVAYVAGLTIDDFLAKWKLKSPAWYQRIIPANRTTSLIDLDDMLKACGMATPSQRWDAALQDPLLKRALISPGRMAELLKKYFVIAGVKIDHNGHLNGSGVGHWVVVENVSPNGVFGGMVDLYNPAPNAMEMYSWKEFISSSPETYGILIQRKGAKA